MWGAQQFWGPKPGTQTGSRFTDDYRNMLQPLPSAPPVGVTTGPAGFDSSPHWSRFAPVPQPLPASPPAGPWPMLPNPDSGGGGGEGSGGGTGGDGGGGGDVGGDPGGEPKGEGGNPAGEGGDPDGEGGEGDPGGEGDGGDPGGDGGGGGGVPKEDTVKKYNEAMQEISEGRALIAEYDENGSNDRQREELKEKEANKTSLQRAWDWVNRDLTIDYGEPDDPADAVWGYFLGSDIVGRNINDFFELFNKDHRANINNWMAQNHTLAGVAGAAGSAAIALVVSAVAAGALIVTGAADVVAAGIGAATRWVSAQTAAAASAITTTLLNAKVDRIARLMRFNPSAAQHMSEKWRRVPIYTQAEAIVTGQKIADPLQMEGYYKYVTTMVRNGTEYYLEVVYNPITHQVQHFQYNH
ncbi:hypothetical protein JW859_06760 [bacterium]|nr:hypothetical protein [bacterium]